MSTDLYRVRVLSVEGDRLTCQVTAFYPRSEDDPPPSRTLALQFLWEAWTERAGRLGQAASIDRELAGQSICDGEWSRANAGRFIRQVEVRDRRWLLDDRWRSVGERPPPAEAREGLVVELPQTQVTYVISATDPRWLEHLRPGMEWGSTAYDKDEKD